MSFLAPQSPQAPAPPPPPPAPPMLASTAVQESGAAQRAAAAAAAGGMGFSKTVASSDQGASKPNTTGKALFGQ